MADIIEYFPVNYREKPGMKYSILCCGKHTITGY